MKKIVYLLMLVGFSFIISVKFEKVDASNAEKKDSANINKPKIEYVEGEVLIKIKENESGLKQIEKDFSLKRKKELPDYKIALLESKNKSTEELINEIKPNEKVEFVQPNYIYRIKTQTTPWGVAANGVQADIAWTANSATGSGVVVAIIDTGVKYDHEDLIVNMWDAPTGSCLVSNVPQACPNHGWDFVSENDTGDGEDGRDNNPMDFHGHGTHVSGTVAAANNSVGVVGVAPGAEIMAIRVLDDNGSGTSADIAAGIDFARENNADVINMSIGGYGYDPTENTAVSAAWDANIVVVAAAGNETETLLSYPGAFQKSIAVGALQENITDLDPYEDMNTRLAYFSNYGFIDVVAPGVNIYSTTYDGSYQSGWSGTSMASPHVAGVAALILEKHPSFTPAQVKQVLESTATDLGRTGRDQYFGSGLVNAVAATATLENKVVLSANFTNDNSEIAPSAYYPALPADGVSTTPIRVWVSDSSGSLVSDVTASFTTDKGTLNQSTAYIAGGTGEVTLISDTTPGTATVSVDVPNYGTAQVEVDMANILLVSDSAEWYYGNNFAWYWDTALQESGEKFVRWNTFWGSGIENYPSVEYMNKFDLVIWYTGDFYVTNTAQPLIASYLDGGGKLFIAGPDQLYWIFDPIWGGYASDTIYADYLKVNYGNDFPSDFSSITGSGIFSGLFLSLLDPGFILGFYPDYITFETGGEQVAAYASGEAAGAIVNGSYRSLYLPFGLESVSTRLERQSLLDYIFSFYLPLSGLSVSSIDSDSALISWNASSVAESYTVSYGADTNATDIGTETTSQNYITITDLSPNTAYYVKVASNLNDGTVTDYSQIVSFTTAGKRPANLHAVSQKAYLIRIRWHKPSDDPDSYLISYGTNKKAANYGTIASDTVSHKFYNLTSNKAYYFKVLAIKNGVYTSYCQIKKIRTRPAKIQHTRIIQYIGKIRFSWSDVRGSGLRYRIRLMDANKNKLAVYQTQKTYKFIKDLTTNSTYYVKVRAIHKKSKLAGKWSKIRKFDIIYQ